jgi:hypothetical protein
MATIIQSTVIDETQKRKLPVVDIATEVAQTSSNKYQQAKSEKIVNPEFKKLDQKVGLLEKEKANLQEKLNKLKLELNLYERELIDYKKSALDEALLEAENQIDAQLIEQKKDFQDLLEKLELAFKTNLIANEETVLEIVFSAVTKLLGDMKQNDILLESYIKNAIEHVVEERSFTIKLSSDDFNRIEKLGLSKTIPGNAEFEIDTTIESGCLIAIDGNGTLDARLESQIRALKSIFVNA